MDFTIEPGFPPPPRSKSSACEACNVGDRPGVRVLNVPSVNIDHEDGIYTALFLCELCVREWARALGMLDVEHARKLKEREHTLHEDLLICRNEIARLGAVKAAIEAAIPEYLASQEDEDGKVECPECGARVKSQGLGAHKRLAHKESVPA